MVDLGILLKSELDLLKRFMASIEPMIHLTVLQVLQ